MGRIEHKFNKNVDKFNYAVNDIPLLAGTSHLIAIMYKVARENGLHYSWKFFLEILDLLVVKALRDLQNKKDKEKYEIQFFLFQ